MLGEAYHWYPLVPQHFSVGNVPGYHRVYIPENVADAIVMKYDLNTSLLTVRLRMMTAAPL